MVGPRGARRKRKIVRDEANAESGLLVFGIEPLSEVREESVEPSVLGLERRYYPLCRAIRPAHLLGYETGLVQIAKHVPELQKLVQPTSCGPAVGSFPGFYRHWPVSTPGRRRAPPGGGRWRQHFSYKSTLLLRTLDANAGSCSARSTVEPPSNARSMSESLRYGRDASGRDEAGPVGISQERPPCTGAPKLPTARAPREAPRSRRDSAPNRCRSDW